MFGGMRRTWVGAGWLIGLVGAGALLLAIGSPAGIVVDWADPLGWIDRNPPELAIAAVARLAGLLLVGWVLATTLVYVTARLAGLDGDVLGYLSIGPLRRMVDTLLAANLVIAAITPAGAAIDPHPPLVAPAPASEMVDPGYVPVPAGFPDEDVVGGEAPDPAGDALASAGPVTVTVAPGDHFWALAERRLSAAWGRCPSDAEIAPYWVRVVAENRDRIRSGNPDLIFPGELVVLPAIDPGN